MTRLSQTKTVLVLVLLAGCVGGGGIWTKAELTVRDGEGLTLLHRAARDGRGHTVVALIAQGAEVDARDPCDRTPLHWAAASGEPEVVGLLLDRGASREARAWYDMTPLHWAALMGHVKAVDALLARGADFEARNFYGMTPLHLAGDPKVVRALVAAHATVGATDDAGMTPLHYAFTEAVAQALIDAGADIFARAKDGRQPISMTVASNEDLAALVVYPDRDRVRLRGDTASLSLLVRNVTARPIVRVRPDVQAEALSVSASPTELAVLYPAQLTSLRLDFARRPGLAPDETKVSVHVIDGERRDLATFTLVVDARPDETPEDTGHVKITTVELRQAPGRLQYLAYAGAPLLLVVLWLFTRRRRSGRAAPPMTSRQ